MTVALPLEALLHGGGGGTPLVVLHGLLGSSRNWQGLGKALGRSRPVHLVDLRNHGASPWSPAMGYPEMAADLAALVRGLGDEPVAVLGHSMGGKVAMALALEEPELVERLIVADIAPIAYAHDFEDFIDAMLGLDLERIDRRAMADDALAATFTEAPIRRFLLQNLDFTSDGRAFWKANLEVLRTAMPAITGWPEAYAGRRYEGPVLALRGGRSPYVSDAGIAAMRALFPALRVATLEGAGHWLHAEAPQPFLVEVEQFLAAENVRK